MEVTKVREVWTRGGSLMVREDQLTRTYRAIDWATDHPHWILVGTVLPLVLVLGNTVAPWITWLVVVAVLPLYMLGVWLGIEYQARYADRYLIPTKATPSASGCSADDAAWAIVHEAKPGRHYAEDGSKVLGYASGRLERGETLDGFLVVDLTSGTGVPLPIWVDLIEPDLVGRHARARAAAREAELAKLRRTLEGKRGKVVQYRAMVSAYRARGVINYTMYLSDEVRKLEYDIEHLKDQIKDLEDEA